MASKREKNDRAIRLAKERRAVFAAGAKFFNAYGKNADLLGHWVPGIKYAVPGTKHLVPASKDLELGSSCQALGTMSKSQILNARY